MSRHLEAAVAEDGEGRAGGGEARADGALSWEGMLGMMDDARNAYDDQVKLLSSLSGLQAPSSAAQMGQLAGNLQGQSNEMLGQSLAALGYLGGKMKGMGTGGAGTTEAANAPIFQMQTLGSGGEVRPMAR